MAMVAARTQIHTRWQIPTHHRQWRRRWGVGWELLRCAMSLLAQGEAAVETIDEAVVVAMDAAAAVATIDEEAQTAAAATIDEEAVAAAAAVATIVEAVAAVAAADAIAILAVVVATAATIVRGRTS